VATPADIIDVISERLGVPRPTVVQHDRLLAIRGHRRISGRGRAARAQPEDAAALLIAVMASSAWGQAVKETTLHYEKYAGLRALRPLTDEPTNWDGVKPLAGLPDGHSLLGVLTRLIRACSDKPDWSAADVWGNAPPNLREVKFEDSSVSIEIAFKLPFPEVDISISALDLDAGVETGVKLSYFMSIAERNAEISQRVPLIDLRQIRYCGSLTLISLGHLFRNEKARTSR
jgi:hypothetical protein